jgi:RimJ/RimL family protein N-acetyltransferase
LKTHGEFDRQPTLKGNLIELRPLRLEDFEALSEAASDPSIWEQHPEHDRYKPEVFRKFFDGAMESKGAFAIIERKSGRIIGSSRYYEYNADRREVMIGFTFLERAFWGRSYNRELKSLMLDHAFQFVDRVIFQVGENNMRSQRALQKIGAQFLAKTELPGPGGSMLPSFLYVITRNSASDA